MPRKFALYVTLAALTVAFSTAAMLARPAVAAAAQAAAAVPQSGAAVSAQNLGWNGTLTPGGTTPFGFLASWAGANPTPTVGCVIT